MACIPVLMGIDLNLFSQKFKVRMAANTKCCTCEKGVLLLTARDGTTDTPYLVLTHQFHGNETFKTCIYTQTCRVAEYTLI